jgi:outer membrane protein assembly factor BamB
VRQAIVLAALLWAAVPAGAAEETAGWPQWGGPLRNGTSPEKGLFSGPFGFKEIWRRPAPGGSAALAVLGGRIFSLSSEEGKDFAFALDAGTGKELWRFPLGASVARQAEFGVPSTPATDGRLVFIVSGECKLLALGAEDGKVAWQHDFKAEYNTGPMPSGCWTSPLLEGNLLILQVNGDPDKHVMAFDKDTGAVVWSVAAPGKGVRTSPAIADVLGARQVVVHDTISGGKGGLYGLRLADGTLLWSLRFAEGESFSLDTPIPLAGDRFGVITWSDVRGVGVKKQGEGLVAEPLWSSRDVRAETQPVTLHAVSQGDHLYGFGGEFLVCLDAATGKTVWKEKTYPGSLIAVDGHLVAISQAAGILRVIEATPAGYREKGRLQVLTPGAPTDTPPSFAGRRIYLRNSEEIVVLEVVPQAK